MADLAGLAGQYKRAIDAYERVSITSLNSNLTKWSAKDYFLKSGACYLADKDPVATKQAIECYIEQDPTFASTRECMLLQDLSEAVEAADEEQFLDKLQAYDSMSKLDKWKMTIFRRVKEEFDAEPDLT